MIAGLALFALAAWRGGRPADPLKGPRLVPWTLVAIFAGAFVLVVGAHFLSFFGIETGQGRPRL
ncbi:hypothetical protein DDZ18_04475 [Marinicauda salina]|uniref:NnrU domain-containing protein n=1 Tax=Marinicauda salina TaxID=2135793 RepID=A0A2U2BXX1_9PROT|nr:hypothetical protein DDZ18_04475 [Marinicauda salina]